MNSIEQSFSLDLNDKIVNAIAFVDANMRFITETDDGSSAEAVLEYRDRATGNVVEVIQRKTSHSASILSSKLAFSPASKRLAVSNFIQNPTGGDTGTVEVMDLGSGETILNGDGYLQKPLSARFSPDGSQFLVFSRESVRAYDIETQEVLWEKTSETHFEAFTYAFHARELVVVESNPPAGSDILILDLSSGEETQRIEEFDGLNAIVSCAISSGRR